MLVVASACTDAISVNLRNGIERYDAYRDLLAGKKVGVVANHTSRVGEQHGVDFLREQGVDVIRVFAPEHGCRGDDKE